MRHTQTRNIFACIFTPRAITGGWLSAASNDVQIHLKTYHKRTLDNLELEHSYIFNPTRIAPIISSWYAATKRTMPVVCAVLGPSIAEQILPLSQAHPTIDNFPISHGPHTQWDYSYLYSHDNFHYFYMCSIAKPLLFQYQLLSITTQLPIESITTEGMALLSLYAALFGDAFRPSQLATSLSHCKNSIEQLFSQDDLERVLAIPSTFSITESDTLPLLIACGLFVQEGLRA